MKKFILLFVMICGFSINCFCQTSKNNLSQIALVIVAPQYQMITIYCPKAYSNYLVESYGNNIYGVEKIEAESWEDMPGYDQVFISVDSIGGAMYVVTNLMKGFLEIAEPKSNSNLNNIIENLQGKDKFVTAQAFVFRKGIL